MPDFTEAKNKLADLYLITKEHQRSIELANSMIKDDKSNAYAYYLRGMNYRETGDTPKAIINFQKAVEFNNNDFNSNLLLGLIYDAQGNRLAIEYFNAALRVRPADVTALFGRASFFQKRKQYQLAMVDYRKISKMEPMNYLCYYNVAYINFELGKFPEALHNFDVCVKMNNDYAPAYYMRGLCQEIMKHKADAVMNYKYTLELEPNYTLAKEGLKRLK